MLLLLRPCSTFNAIPWWQRSFSKTLSWRNFTEKAGFEDLWVLVWTENTLKTELFGNDAFMIIMWFPWPSVSQTQIILRSVYANHLMSCQSVNAAFNFSVAVCVIVIRSLQHARFWVTDGNRKWAIFSFNLPSHNHIDIAKYLSSIRGE